LAQRSKCTECAQAGTGGGGICDHGKQRDGCKECAQVGTGGGGICVHGKRRDRCKECAQAGTGGGSICGHGKRRSKCKECNDAGTGGSSICDHGRQSNSCAMCSIEQAVEDVLRSEDVSSLSLREHDVRAAEIYGRLRNESPYSQMMPKSFEPLAWADPEAKDKKGAHISSAQECRRQSQDSDRLDAAAAAAGPQMHALGSVLRAPILRLLELALQHEVQLREVAEDASVPPHTGLSVSIVAKTSTGRLRKGYASTLKDSFAKELLALQGFIAEMLAARLPGFDRERMYDTMYDSSRDDPGTLQPVRQNRTKAVISLTDTAGGGFIRLSPLSPSYLAKEGKEFDNAQRVWGLGRHQAALLGFALQYPGETPEARVGGF
jgi:hypothetical protein